MARTVLTSEERLTRLEEIAEMEIKKRKNTEQIFQEISRELRETKRENWDLKNRLEELERLLSSTLGLKFPEKILSDPALTEEIRSCPEEVEENSIENSMGDETDDSATLRRFPLTNNNNNNISSSSNNRNNNNNSSNNNPPLFSGDSSDNSFGIFPGTFKGAHSVPPSGLKSMSEKDLGNFREDFDTRPASSPSTLRRNPFAPVTEFSLESLSKETHL